jgi:Short C-terminal domain
MQSQAKHAIEGSHPGTTIRLSCGHAASITDPQTISWLSVEGDLSYRCPVCSAERPIVAIGEDATAEPNHVPNEARAAVSNRLVDELERLSSLQTSGALTEAEFQAAKARLLGTQ